MIIQYYFLRIFMRFICIIFQSVTFCKATLNEYAAKLHMKLPTYTTVEHKSVIPYFICTVDFNGTSYTGEAAGRKRDAENLAARSAIFSLIGIILTQFSAILYRLLYLMVCMQFVYESNIQFRKLRVTDDPYSDDQGKS
jgi:hypothetical protein